MSFYVYILLCSDGSYYTGHTDNLEQRVAAHELGSIPGYTVDRRPVKLVFAQDFPSRAQAFERERQVKGWSRRKKKALIQGEWDNLRRLSKSGGSTGSPCAVGRQAHHVRWVDRLTMCGGSTGSPCAVGRQAHHERWFDGLTMSGGSTGSP